MSPEAPASEFVHQRRVEFADTDLGGLIHFSRFFIFMESTEHLFLESLGAPIHSVGDDGEIGWPRVGASCEFVGPARFGDLLTLHLLVEHKGSRSMGYLFRCWRDDQLICRGHLRSVCCRMGGERLQSVAIPEPLASRLAQAASERLELEAPPRL